MKVSPAQLRPFQLASAQERPAQERPAQLVPAQERPAQLRPFQVAAGPAAPVAGVSAQLRPSQAWPKMSCSPVSSAPVSGSATWPVPRAASSEPSPVEAGKVWAAVEAVVVSTACLTSMRPAPWRRRSVLAIGSAVLVRMRLTWSGVRVGRCCSSRAAAPETTAAAWEVPLPRKKRAGVVVDHGPRVARRRCRSPGSRRLTIERPGATRSGVRVALPRLEKVATVSSLRSSVPWWSAAPTART